MQIAPIQTYDGPELDMVGNFAQGQKGALMRQEMQQKAAGREKMQGILSQMGDNPDLEAAALEMLAVDPEMANTLLSMERNKQAGALHAQEMEIKTAEAAQERIKQRKEQIALETRTAMGAVRALEGVDEPSQKERIYSLYIKSVEDQGMDIPDDLRSGWSPENEQNLKDIAEMGQMMLELDPSEMTTDMKNYQMGQRDPEFKNFLAETNAQDITGTEAIVNNLMKEDPELSYAEAVAMAQGLARKGQTIKDGKVVPMEGAPEAASVMAGAEAEGMPAMTASDDDELIGQESGETIWNKIKLSAIRTFTLLGIDTSAELTTLITDETGSGAAVFAVSPVFTTPNIGSATGSISGNAATSSALAADPANCSAGSAPVGIAADGSVQSCFDVWTEAENTAAGYTNYTDEKAQDAIGAMVNATLEYDDATPYLRRAAITGDISIPATSNASTIGADKILESMLKAVNSATDEDCLTYESTTGDFEWTACASGGGDAVSIDGVGVTDPDFVSTGDIDFVDTANDITANYNADSLLVADVADGDWGDFTIATNAATLDTDSVSANELNATGVEAELEAVLDLQELQGAVTDGQVPNNITIDLASAATALAADPSNCATSTHFAVGVNASGTAECEAIADADVPNTITVDLAATVTTNANLTGEVTSSGNATTIADSIAVSSWNITTPILSGKVNADGSAVNDDDCTGEIGSYWYDDTDSAFEFCNANTGAPATISGTPGGSDRDVQFNNGGSFGGSSDFMYDDVTKDLYLNAAISASIQADNALSVSTGDGQVFNVRTNATSGNYVGVRNGADSAGNLRIYEDSDDGNDYTQFSLPAGGHSGNILYTLPTDDGDAGEQLQTNGTGTLTWESAGGVPTTITVADTTDSTSFCGLFESATGDLGPKTDGGCLYAADTGTLSSTIFNTPTLTLTGTGTLNGLDAIDGTGETTLEAALDIGGEVVSTGMGSTVIADSVQVATWTMTGAPGLAVNNGATGPGSIRILEDSDNGSNYVELTVVSSMGSNRTVTLPNASVTLASLTGTEVFTNKTIDADATGNVISNIENADIKAAAVIAHSKMATALKTLYIPATAMKPTTTAGCAPLAAVEISSSQPEVFSLNCDASTDEKAQFQWVPPKGWNNGTITYAIYWSHAATVTNFAAVFGLECLAVSNDDTIGAAYGTAVTVTDTGGTTNDLYVSPTSSALTIGGTPADADEVFCRVYRDADAGGDTLAIDARLMGVAIFYTQTTADDT